MSRSFYSVPSSSSSPSPIAELTRETCKDETIELQNRLAAEPGLLAGDQMNEASPRTWLLLRREMPITNPSTGTLGFSLDFLYVDQDGTPTFVEAKRCNDPRARRDIIGQVLEYVANAQAYWQDVDIQQALTKTYESEAKATEAIRQHQGDAGLSLADFTTAFLQQVRESAVRIVLFLENSSYELRTLVEFLNQQLKTITILIVEARQYRLPDSANHIIVPRVVGFSESVRIAKENSRIQRQELTTLKGEQAFWSVLEAQRSPDQVRAIRTFLNALASHENVRVTWIVSAICLLPASLPTRGLFGVRKSGELELYFSYWNPEKHEDLSDTQVELKNQFQAGLVQMGFAKLQGHTGFPTLKLEDWLPKAEQIIALVVQLAS